MQKQPTDVDDPDAGERRTQRLVLGVVTDKEQPPWSVEEIVRTLTSSCSRMDIEDALDQLRIHGLINQADGLVFASRAAAHVDWLEMLGV
jgi:hypothetical protein